MAGKQRWVPLESNPEVLNKYITKLGVKSSEWEFVDIYGLEPDLLMMVPNRVVAVMLLYPITEKSEVESIGEVVEQHETYFVKQTIGNACGTVAIVHALANNDGAVKFNEESPFAKFLEATKDLSPPERATCLEKDTSMGAAHEDSAQEGQTQPPSAEDHVNTHFVAFICNEGNLYEMNGRSEGPILHGKTSDETLLQDTADVVKKFMARDPKELNFTVMALTKKE
ncbi:ubiquitin carboxyl-terminal hydrolase-like [Pecten maximus]|uniref:ubiquitin carboxyl-terminal hydrolase-like n=1 Tax=Pecten maximus TaxID=6579 RepID=UPI001458C4AE|nr:ubiquitin carboxyl-terminal hydrolase-like [Pecten maximus]